MLKEAEAGAKAEDLCRKRGISDATFYNWKAKHCGMTVSEARRLKELKAENAKRKRLRADSELDNAALKDLLGRKMVSPQLRRQAVETLMSERGFGITHACEPVGVSRSPYG